MWVEPNCPAGAGVVGLNKFYTGTLRPKVKPLTPLYTIFHEKGSPFVYFLLTNVSLSHTLFRSLHPF